MTVKKAVSYPLPIDIPKLALVVWEDAAQVGNSVWVENEAREYKPHIFWQAGFVIKDVPEGIHITEAWSPSLVANPTQIPRGMIRSIKYI